MKGALCIVLCVVWLTHETTANSREKRDKRSLWKGIYPGTKWCGLNDIASSYSDLGKHRLTDACCRAHDKKCLVRIKPFQHKYHRRNMSFKVKSDCECERRFKACLDKAGTSAARNIYELYFETIHPDCIKLKPYTYSKCVKRKWWGGCAKHQTFRSMKAHFYDLRKELNI